MQCAYSQRNQNSVRLLLKKKKKKERNKTRRAHKHTQLIRTILWYSQIYDSFYFALKMEEYLLKVRPQTWMTNQLFLWAYSWEIANRSITQTRRDNNKNSLKQFSISRVLSTWNGFWNDFFMALVFGHLSKEYWCNSCEWRLRWRRK